MPDVPITAELLEDGSFLKRAIEICSRNRTSLNLLQLARILRDSTVWIPCTAINVSAAEIDEQDTHQLIVIGVAAIVPHAAMADSLMDEISRFVEENTEAEIIDEQREFR